MAITLDVITRVTEASLKGTSKQIQGHIEKTGQQSGEGFAKGFAEGVSRNSGDMQKAFDKAADAAGKLRVETQKLNDLQAKGSSRSQLIAQAERVAKARRDEERAVNAATDAYRRYHRQVSDVSNGFDVVNRSASGVLNILSNLTAGTRFGGLISGVSGMTSGFTAAGTAVGGLGASMAATAAIASGTLVVGLAAAAAGLVALTNELYKMGGEWDDTFDSIVIKTGATGDVLEQIKASIKGVAGDVPASLGEIGDAAAAVAQNLKLVGPGADDMIRSLARLKSSGIDVDVHGLGMAFRALKVDQKDYQSTLEKFLNFSQKTGVPIDSITSSIEANAGALQAFGFNTDEVLAILGKFEEQGIDPDKGIGALGKAFKALTDAGKAPTKENLQEVFDEINGFAASGQAVRANEEINQLFGARGNGLSWLPLITDGKLSLQEIANGGEAARTSIQGMGDQTDDAAQKWEMFKNDTKAALEPLSSEVFNFTNEALGSIIAWLRDSKPEIIGFFTFASTQVVNFAQMVVETIGFTFMQIGTLGEHIPFIGDKFKGLKEAGQDLMKFGNKLDALQTKLQTLGDRANERAQNARNFYKEIAGGSALKDALKILDDGKTVVLKDNSPEVLKNIDKTKYELEHLPDGQVKVVPKTDDATREMQDWIDETKRTPITLDVGADVTQAKKDIKNGLLGESFDIPIGAIPDAGGPLIGPGGDVSPLDPGIPVRGTPGRGFPMPWTLGGTSQTDGAHGQISVANAIASKMGLQLTAGKDHHDKDGGLHPAGMAGDFSNRGGWTATYADNSPEMLQFAKYMAANFRPYIAELIYDAPGWNGNIKNGQWAPGNSVYDESTLKGHTNHVHLAIKDEMAAAFAEAVSSGGMRRFGPGGTAALSNRTSTDSAGMLNYGPNDTSPLPPGTPSPIAGLEPGPVGSTFGYNEFGEPGYYRPDKDSIRSAERSKKNADDAVTKAEEQVSKLEKKIAEIKATKNTLTDKKAQEDIANLRDQIKDQQDRIADLKDNAAEADRRLAEARQGRFTEAREAKRGKNGKMGQIGADLADDFGISEGLPGMAKWLTTFLANLAFAPMLGQLSAISAASPYQGGYGAIGVAGAQRMDANGGSLFPALTAATQPLPPTIGPAPLGGGAVHQGSGAAPGPTPLTSVSPAAAGGGGFNGIGGAPLAAATTAAAGLDMLAPGAGQAAQTGIQLVNRTIGYAGQLAGIGVGGLLETFLPHGSALADPSKSWPGKILAGVSGARPALPNQAGEPAKPQTPQQAAALQAQTSGGQANGPMVHVENMNNYTPDGGQSLANQIGRMQMAGYSSGGQR